MGVAPLKGTLRRALGGHAVFRFIALVLGFAFQVMVVKLLAPEEYATYAILLATLLVGERLLSFGTDRTVLRHVPALLLRRDRAGIRSLAKKLGLVRVAGLAIFIVALTFGAALHVPITPGELGTSTTILFGAWFVGYTLQKEADAVAQSMIIHHWAALVACCEVLLRFSILVLLYVAHRPIDVMTLVSVYALTSSLATAGLLFSIWRTARSAHGLDRVTVASPVDGIASDHRNVKAFASAAYASTLSYLISSPGVIRLVARAGLGVYELAAFSFVQGFATSLASALPGQLILPSLESVAAKMADSGRRERVFPTLSLLFKVELTLVLSIIIAATLAGASLITILSRGAYAPFYFILPVLMVGVCCQTVYRLIEILGSMHLKYHVFLTMWPLSIAAMVALYFAVGRWGLISVLVIPIVEISTRLAILSFAFRHHGIGKVLDPARSLRLVAAAAMILSGALYLLGNYGGALDSGRLIVAAGAVAVFLLTTPLLRPISGVEYETLAGFLPRSWRVASTVARRFARA